VNGPDDRRTGVLAGLGAYGLWGLFPLYFHALGAASATEIIAHRVVWTFVLMSVAVATGRRWRRVGAMLSDPVRLARIWGAGLLLSGNWLVYVWAVLHDRVIDASLGYFINPVATVALGVLVLHESLSRLQKAAVGFGLTAVVVLIVGYGQFPWVSLGLAATFSTYTLLKKTVALDTVTSLFMETMAIFPIAVAALVWFGFRGDLALGHVDRGLDARLLGLGIVSAIPLLLFGMATQRIPMVLLGLLQYLTPGFILLLGWLYFHEDMPAQRWIGFALIWVALICLSVDGWSRREPAQRRTPQPAVSPEG
jgi:chloramphenicol-sensitive protein RarD